jgi:hypothetical protein
MKQLLVLFGFMLTFSGCATYVSMNKTITMDPYGRRIETVTKVYKDSSVVTKSYLLDDYYPLYPPYYFPYGPNVRFYLGYPSRVFRYGHRR